MLPDTYNDAPTGNPAQQGHTGCRVLLMPLSGRVCYLSQGHLIHKGAPLCDDRKKDQREHKDGQRAHHQYKRLILLGVELFVLL
jgi:hypothetical protein